MEWDGWLAGCCGLASFVVLKLMTAWAECEVTGHLLTVWMIGRSLEFSPIFECVTNSQVVTSYERSIRVDPTQLLSDWTSQRALWEDV